MTLLHNYEGPLGVDQLNIWANYFGLAHPVLDDGEQLLSGALWPGDPSRPNAVLLGPGGEILMYSPTVEDIEALFQ